jgi:hypothetical protein
MKPELKLRQRVGFYTKNLKRTLKKLQGKEIKKTKDVERIAQLKRLELVALAEKLLALAIEKTDNEEIVNNGKILELMSLGESVQELTPVEKEFEKQKTLRSQLADYMDDIARILRREPKHTLVRLEQTSMELDDQEEEIVVDEEWASEEDDDVLEPEMVEPKKKNRRGQQARRAYMMLT